MGESDILLSLGLESQPVLDAFEAVKKASGGAFNQAALDAYSKKLTELQTQMEMFNKSVASQGVTSKGISGVFGDVKGIEAQRRNISQMINEMQTAQAKITTARDNLAKSFSNQRNNSTAANFLGFNDADADKQIAKMKEGQDKIVKAREDTAKRLQNVQVQANMAQEREDDAFNERMRKKNSFVSGSDRAAATNRMRQIYAPGGDMERAAGDPVKARALTDEARGLNAQLAVQETHWQKSISLFGQHIVQWGAYAIALTAAFEILSKIGQTFQDAIKYAAEFQSQTVNFTRMQDIGKQAGIPYQGASSNELLTSSIALAEKYGDNINDVSEAMALWYKQTGSMNNALYMTNEAMKVQLATGLDLEDFYRGFTAIAFQAQDIKLTPQSKQNFNLGQSPQLANMIYTASMLGGAGMGTQHRQDAAGIGETSNAFETLQKASEQDVSALGKLHLSMEAIIAVNQGMITAMGNTGQGAESAAEHIGRLVGGFESLSKVSNATSFHKNLGLDSSQFENFRTIMNQSTSSTGGDASLEKMAKWYGTLSEHAKAVFSTTVASQRNFETMGNVIKVILGTYSKLYDVQKDGNALEKTAEIMQGTYNTEVDKTAAKWQAVVMILGTEMLPLIQNIIGAMGGMFSNLFEGIGRAQDSLHAMDPATASPRNKFLGMLGPPGQLLGKALDEYLPQNGQTPLQQRLSAGRKYSPEVERILNTPGAGDNWVLEQLASKNHLKYMVPAGSKDLSSAGAVAGGVEWASKKLDGMTERNFDLAQYRRTQAGLPQGGGGGGDLVPEAKTTAPKGKMGPDLQRTAMDEQRAGYSLLDASIQVHLDLADRQTTIDERSASRKGMDHDAMVALNNDYKTQISLLNTLEDAQKKSYAGAERQAKSDFKAAGETPSMLEKMGFSKYDATKLGATGPGADTKDPAKRSRDIRDAAAAVTMMATILDKMGSNQSKIDDLADKASQTGYKNAQFQIDQVFNNSKVPLAGANMQFSDSQNMNQKRDALNTIIGLEAQQNNELQKQIANAKVNGATQEQINDWISQGLDLTRDMTSKEKEYGDEVRSIAKDVGNTVLDIQDKTIKAALPLSSFSKGQQEDISAQIDINKENLDYTEKIAEYQREGVPDSTLQQLTSMHNNWVQIAEAAAAYKEKLDQIQSLPAYAAMDDLFKGLSKFVPEVQTMGVNGPTSIAGGVANQALGITAAQQYLVILQNQAAALTNQKDILGYIYNSQITHTQEQKEAYDLENLEIQDQIKNMQTLESVKQEQLSHPSEFTQLAKSTYDSFTQGLFTQGQAGFMGLISGTTGGTAQQQMTQAVSQFNSSNGVAAQLSAAITQYFAPAANALAQKLGDNTSGPGGPLTSNINVANQGNYALSGTVNVSGSIAGVNQSAQATLMQDIGAFGAAGMVGGVAAGFQGAGMNTSTSLTTGASTFRGTASGIPNAGNYFGGLGGSTALGGGFSGTGTTPSSPNFSSENWNVTAANSPTGYATNTGGFNIGMGSGLGGHYLSGATPMTYLSLLSAGYGLFQDVTQGPGGLQGGITGAEEGAEIGSLFPGAGTVIGAGVGFLAGLFGGNHTNPADMPDKYDTQRFTMYVGELQGAAGTAYGPSFNAGSDPVMQALGGKSMLQYIQQWIIANMNSPDPVKKKLAMQLKPQYGTTGGGLGFDTDIGDEWVKGGSLSGTYISIYAAAQQAIQEIMQLTGDTAQPNQLVALNQYGGGGGSFGFSWNTPGYDAPFTPPGQGGGTPPSQQSGGFAGPNNSPGGGSSPNFGGAALMGGGGGGYAYSVPSYSPGGMSINTSHDIGINLDGRQIARTVQAYNIRTQAQGYNAISI